MLHEWNFIFLIYSVWYNILKFALLFVIPTPEGTLRTCSSGGQPQAPPGFTPLEGEDATEDGEVISVSVEEQLQLWALRIKNRNLQKQKEILEAKRQRVSVQTKVRQMIWDEEQRAQELEQEITLM